ncbi:MAG: methyltransferase family protein [Paracoccaceae bacterium]
MKILDYPPVWLAAFVVLVWGLTVVAPDLMFSWPGQGEIALVLLSIGLILTALAVFEMFRARTTIIPRRDPNALVTTGIFRFSRNPIYLGDAFMLAASALWFQIWPALLLVPLFAGLIQIRFINAEEAILNATFGEEFEQWQQQTRRWI